MNTTSTLMALFAGPVSITHTAVQHAKNTQNDPMEAAIGAAMSGFIRQGAHAVGAAILRHSPNAPLPTPPDGHTVTLQDATMIQALVDVTAYVLTKLHNLPYPDGAQRRIAQAWMTKGRPALDALEVSATQATDTPNATFTESEVQAQLNAMEDGCASGACKL